MSTELRVLHLEDSAIDAELVHRQLRQTGLAFAVCRVLTAPDFLAQLHDAAPDLILADYSLPAYDGFLALETARAERPEIPFIFVSGTLGEEIAIEALHRGATDYVLKTRLARLGPAVTRALREVREQRQRRLAENALLQAKEDWERTFDAVPDLIALLDCNHKIVRVNQAMAARLKTTPQACVGAPCYQLLHGTDHPPDYCPHARLLADGQPHQAQAFEPRLDGNFLITTSPLFNTAGQLAGCVHVARDNSTQIQAEARVEHLNQLLRALRGVNQLVARERDVRLLLSGACHILVQTRGYVLVWIGLAEPGAGRVVPRGSAGHDAGFLKATQPLWENSLTGAAVRDRRPCVCQNIAEDPAAAPWRQAALARGYAAAAAVPMEHGGKLFGALTVYAAQPGAFDSEEATLLNETATDLAFALHNLEARDQVSAQARLLDLARDAILVRDMQDRIVYWNKGAERLYGWTSAEALGRCAGALLRSEGAAPAPAQPSLLAQGEWAGELRQLTKAGQEIVVHSRWTLVLSAAGAPESVLIINTDLTESKKLEAQFLHAQRLESIGQLASGIAHDLNNILAPILLAGPMLSQEIQDEENRGLIDMMTSTARRGAELVKQILLFARGVKANKAPVQLAYILKDLTKLLRETIPPSVEIRTDISSSLWLMEADQTQLHQVVMNLCVNARDAMLQGGTLAISARNVLVEPAQAARIPNATPGPHVLLTVTDTGTGISPENLGRVFDPFFTTKATGMGTGLGLSTVMGIVRNHSGFLTVESRLGAGTQFQIYLPATPNSAAQAEIPSTLAPHGQGEMILIVDDEEGIRAAMTKALENNGYRVLSARDGAEALALFARHRLDVRAVLMDLLMPHADGMLAIRALRAMAPKVKIAVCTGSTLDTHQQELTDLGIDDLLRKPFSSQMMLSALRELLGRPS